MTTQFMNDILLILPELVLFIGALGLLMVGAFSEKDATRTVDYGAVGLLALAGVLAAGYSSDATAYAFNKSFVMDSFASLMKVLTFAATAVAIIMSQRFLRREN
jgi:NADH:ubiquinone oxidoreductase subunit 2 (chain N)